jgi:hypothetical protein
MKRNFGGIGAAPVSSFFYFLSDLRASRKKQNFSAGMCAIFMERILVLEHRTAPNTAAIYNPFPHKNKKRRRRRGISSFGVFVEFP